MPGQHSRSDVRTKIIATLGPASANRETLTRMFDVGLDVCRLNFSHGTYEQHAHTLELVRTLAAERGQCVAVIGDLCGPKLRLGIVPDDGVRLKTGQTVRIVAGDAVSTAECLAVSHGEIITEADVGQRVLINDGLVRLTITGRAANALVCTVDAGGPVRSHKGVNLPDTVLSLPALTEKDRADLAWALQHEVDYVALSFVRQPEDLYELRRAIKQLGHDVPVIIKIEKPEALEHIDELIAETDAVLVARGDLGVETDLWRVPLVQKDLVARCRAAAVPVIVATQMLESMIQNPVPTRAEVSDVANAIFDGADAVMLSGETAVGTYPVDAVDMMNRVADATGSFIASQPPDECRPTMVVHYQATAAVAHAAVQAARDLDARCVAVWTATGATVRRVARHRLAMPVVGLTYDPRVARQLNLLYGVLPVVTPPLDHPAKMAAELDERLIALGVAEPHDIVVVVTSTKPTTPGATDTVLVHRVHAAAEGDLRGV